MVQRIALLIGGLGAAAVLAFALGLFNFAVAWPWNTANTANVTSASDSQQVAQADNSATNSAAQNAQPQTKTVVDKVYVAPAPPARANNAANNSANQPAAQATAPRAAKPNNSGSTYSKPESEGSGGHHGGDD
jgi:cytoskeletal protein RodZ